MLAGRTRTQPLRAAAAAIAFLAIAAPGTANAAGTISVVGQASQTAPNDTARLRFRVVTQAPTAVLALTRNSARARKVVNAIKARGIPAADIKTETVSLDRVRLKRKHQPARTVYRATNSVVVVVRVIDRVAGTIDAAVAAGATGVSGIQFSTSQKEALYREALGTAFDRAKAKAELLADRAGVTLGLPIQIDEGFQDGGYADPLGGGGASGVPIEPGTSTVRAEVTVVFAIL